MIEPAVERRHRHLRCRPWLAVWWAACVSCLVLSGAVDRPVVAQHSASAEAGLYDLQRDEALGGHTLARHVGRSDQQLADRLRREPDISAASTYTDVITARRTVAAALQVFRDRVGSWEARQGSRPNLVLHYTQRDGTPIGRSLARGEQGSRPCNRALVVLRWLQREHQWIVLTSYPELAR